MGRRGTQLAQLNCVCLSIVSAHHYFTTDQSPPLALCEHPPPWLYPIYGRYGGVMDDDAEGGGGDGRGGVLLLAGS